MMPILGVGLGSTTEVERSEEFPLPRVREEGAGRGASL
jgi:hypothetical protein